MSTVVLLIGLAAIVIGIGEHSWSSWRRRLLFYTWGATVALAAAYVLPIIMGEVVR